MHHPYFLLGITKKPIIPCSVNFINEIKGGKRLKSNFDAESY